MHTFRPVKIQEKKRTFSLKRNATRLGTNDVVGLDVSAQWCVSVTVFWEGGRTFYNLLPSHKFTDSGCIVSAFRVCFNSGNYYYY